MVNGNKLCFSTVIRPAKLHSMTNSHGNEEDLCLDFGKFPHAARGLIRHKYSTVSQEREKPKHTGGRRSAHRIKEMDGAFTRKTPLLSRWRLVSFITRSILRDKAYWIGWSLNRVVQLWDNLGHERISWELHSTSELRENVRLWESVISP